MSASDKVQPQRAYRARSAIFIAVHLTPLMLIWAGFSWWGIALCVISYYVRMFGVTAGYHRFFAHRSYKTSRPFQFFLAFLAQTSAQKGALWWAAHHRHHHAASDQPDDVHSPEQSGFFYAHVGWVLARDTEATEWSRIRDLAKYPELVWLNRYHLVPPLVYAAAMYLLFGLEGLVWGFFISTILLWHGTFLVNSVVHVLGRRVYPTTDSSRNNWWVALLTMGEGWHNNHHFYQRATAQGWRWYEVDMTYYLLKGLSWLGLVSGVSRPPRHIVAQRLSRAAALAATPLAADASGHEAVAGAAD